MYAPRRANSRRRARRGSGRSRPASARASLSRFRSASGARRGRPGTGRGFRAARRARAAAKPRRRRPHVPPARESASSASGIDSEHGTATPPASRTPKSALRQCRSRPARTMTRPPGSSPTRRKRSAHCAASCATSMNLWRSMTSTESTYASAYRAFCVPLRRILTAAFVETASGSFFLAQLHRAAALRPSGRRRALASTAPPAISQGTNSGTGCAP